jgi:hypothetical protein
MGRIDSLTSEQKSRFGEWSQRWIKTGLSMEPADFDAATEAALRGYKLAGLDRPMVILRVGSPYAATVGGALAWMFLRTQVRDQAQNQVVTQVMGQVWDQIMTRVWTQVWDQVWNQVLAQVGAQVKDQVWNQVGDQVGIQVWDQVWAQVENQVWAQVGFQVRAQVRDQIGAQIGTQVWEQVWDQVGAQVRDQVRDLVPDQVQDQVRDQVWDQVWDQIGTQVRDQVWAQVVAQVRDQVRDHVGVQVQDQVRDQIGTQVGNQVWTQVEAQVGAQAREQVGNQEILKKDYVNQVYGSHDASWLAFYDFFRNECGLKNETEKLSGLKDLSSNCGWWSPYKNICIIQNRHSEVHFDENKMLHNDKGPAVKYRDGFSVWSIHGVRVDRQIVVEPESQTIDQINNEENEEIRRIRIDRFGWGRFLKESGAKIIQERFNERDMQFEKLFEIKGGQKRIQVKDPSTGREYFLGVPREINSCQEAQNWMSCGLDQYAIHRS